MLVRVFSGFLMISLCNLQAGCSGPSRKSITELTGTERSRVHETIRSIVEKDDTISFTGGGDYDAGEHRIAGVVGTGEFITRRLSEIQTVTSCSLSTTTSDSLSDGLCRTLGHDEFAQAFADARVDWVRHVNVADGGTIVTYRAPGGILDQRRQAVVGTTVAGSFREIPFERVDYVTLRSGESSGTTKAIFVVAAVALVIGVVVALAVAKDMERWYAP